jgi:hypothetical protein
VPDALHHFFVTRSCIQMLLIHQGDFFPLHLRGHIAFA